MSSGAKLAAKVLDAVDLVLSKNGMAFREEQDWENYAGEMVGLLYKYYADLQEEDSNYVPPSGTSGSDDMEDDDEEGSDSATLGSSDD